VSLQTIQRKRRRVPPKLPYDVALFYRIADGRKDSGILLAYHPAVRAVETWSTMFCDTLLLLLLLLVAVAVAAVVCMFFHVFSL